ncbi:uncharacterized protein LOC131470206 [Solea solea]|uniref:uncharacterized protein LOC131470206 n=1 Tax=Solea solea TaxID=90069 RepID=UPI00272BA653|nr:uncharacterized protein LOC131470206 [Solea solea]
MACFAATLGIVILSGHIKLSAANKEACDLYAAVGQSRTLPLVYKGLTNKHILRWTHNKTIIFYREKGRVSVGKTGDVSATGDLQLKAVQFSSAGDYQAHLLHPNGTFAQSWIVRLCVLNKVSKPKLTYVCDFKSGAVNLNCNVAKPQGLLFSWTLDDKTLQGEERQTLSISLAHLKGVRNFTCSVANNVSKERSDTVCPACKSPSPSPQSKELCFKPATVVLALAGGLTLIVLLLIITITLCCCHRRNKTQKTLTGKGDVRMLSLNKRGSGSISPDYETMHPTENTTLPSHQPSLKACYQEVSQPDAQSGGTPLDLPTAAETKQPSPDAQSGGTPLDLPTAAETKQPSPVPKPRTKSPHQTAKLT